MKLNSATLLLFALAPFANAKDITIGLNADPDALDPALSRTMVGREIYASLFDKLIDVDQQLNYIPALATKWEWVDDNKGLLLTLRQDVTFHDGTPFNADAVKFNLDRAMTIEGSRRKDELEMVDHVEVVDEFTAKIVLKAPFMPLLAVLADRAGMMVSPTAVKKEGKAFQRHPIGSGPFKFDNRVSQDRIVLTKFNDYWEADRYHFDKVTFLPLPDSTIRLANLQSGQLDIAERIAPSDIAAVNADPDLTLAEANGVGYNGITFNLGYGAYQDKNMAVTDPKVRAAFEYALDRNVLNQVVFAGQYLVENQWVNSDSPFHAPNLPIPERDVEKAKTLLKQAGYDSVNIELLIPNTTESIQLGQVLQAMESEAGINITLKTVEFATSLDMQTKGEYEAILVGWSGRIDPDGNIYPFYGKNSPLNENGFDDQEVQEWIVQARGEADVEKRKQYYAQAMKKVLDTRPLLYFYFPKWQWGVSKEIQGFKAYGDGIPRLRDVQ